MNVPPVAATQTEWRACGPAGGYSLPVCFNDSDTELSTRGTPISSKVQMIIESLRSSQSSLEMGDEVEGNGLSGQEVHPQVCKVAVGSYVAARAKTKSSTEHPQDDVSSPNIRETSDSDSDDSVDRGIEEAILEYLKEKDDHKRKGEPCSELLQSSKSPRKCPVDPEVPAQTFDSNTCSFAASQFAKCVQVEDHTTPATIPIKKYIKSKASLTDSTVESFDLSKSATKSLVCFTEQTMSSSSTAMSASKTVHCPVEIKTDEESNDSSSDDGIEEAIQIYQLEKKEQLVKRELFNPHAFDDDESDSTSDDGIEEAIRCYQLEQLKERSALNSFLHKEKSFSKSLIHSVGSTSTELTKKHKLKKKRARMDREKSCQPATSGLLSKTLSDGSKDKGNGLHSFKIEGLLEQPTPPAPKVNTSAELMCAEAILDISKTVMPGPFQQTAGRSSCVTTEPTLQSSPPDNCPDDESNDSSVDSEDGIEQEIRKFLEQKAQMQKQPPDMSSVSKEPSSVSEQEKVKAKEPACQTKPQKLSLTQRRKVKEKNVIVSSTSDKVGMVQEKSPKLLPEPIKESNPVMFFQSSQTHPASGLTKAGQSGDKSSSLDSDEDLDTAIKDLLKTKKKSKKKVRDLKRKSRKGLKDEESLTGSAVQVKKLRPDPGNKCNPLQRAQKSTDDMKDKFGLSEMSASQLKQNTKSEELGMLEDKKETEPRVQDTSTLPRFDASPQIKDDSSSVDSDDSIELEIRRFLAEKAKVSTAGTSRDEDVLVSGTETVCDPSRNENIKQENQLAEIPRKCASPLSGLPHHSSPAQNRLSPLASQSTPQDISIVSGQSRLSSVEPPSPSLLEPADGAGAVRTEQKRPNNGRDDLHNINPPTERVRPVFSPNVTDSRSESIKWRQSLGLPVPVVRAPSRTPFQITSSDIAEAAAPLPYQSSGVQKSQTPGAVWSFARTSKTPFPSAPETPDNTTYRSTVLNYFSTAKQHPRVSFSQSLMPGHRSQCSGEGERERTVHISKDKSVYVELESNRTNHVQVQSRDRIEGKQRTDSLSKRQREGENMKIDHKELHLDRKEEEFKDEADCDSVDRRSPKQTQGFSTL